MTDCKLIIESLGGWLMASWAAPTPKRFACISKVAQRAAPSDVKLEKLQVSLKSLLVSDVPHIAFEPFWSGVRERITTKRSWYEGIMEWARPTFAGPGLAWTVPAVIVVLLAGFSLDSFWKLGAPRNNFAAVESIDAHGRNVALLREDETKTTVIWLYQNQEGENESSGENTETSPSF